ncbi:MULTISPECIES: AI-2E family transporter [unclassified Luteibacter]|uniref:AI-2E family transporter n=1 Tax=unclassified Luteibacter TaxID=2620188 RepID=UPI0008BE1989|nr:MULTISPECIES: AI-2E family transporter [unclassified Luteibacter]MDR6937940.1 putative PurR-regulated permease PerM [Luteibacter sp. 3190]SEW21129.1 Predicted PurR-regulated permease PerM [Luteibacter sp. 329MFSha]
MEVATSRSHAVRIASYIAAGLGLFLVLYLRLLPALLAGLLVYEVVVSTAPLMGRRLSGDRARVLVVALVGVLVVGLLTLLVFGGISFFRNEIGNPEDLWQNRLMPLVERARQQLPPAIVDRLPDSVEALRVTAMDWARSHAVTLQLAGKEAARVVVHILIGLVLGAIVALSRTRPTHQVGPFAAELSLRAARLADAFHNIVFAQIKISLFNTLFTAIYLLAVLPMFGVHLPLTKTLIVITFVVGLLPVIGNLLSNTAITVVGLSVSLYVGLGALAFLIVIHKFEYFLNARIVGSQIRARAWELLVAMLLFEAAFGLPGVVAAPIFYAYLKAELEAERLI